MAHGVTYYKNGSHIWLLTYKAVDMSGKHHAHQYAIRGKSSIHHTHHYAHYQSHDHNIHNGILYKLTMPPNIPAFAPDDDDNNEDHAAPPLG